MPQTLTTFGIEKIRIMDVLDGLDKRFKDIRSGLVDLFPEIHIQLDDLKAGHEGSTAVITAASDWLKENLGDYILDVKGASMAEVVGRLLLNNGSTIAVAESCTGGLISHLLTSVAGSSDYFLFSAVTYSNNAKIDVLDVSTDTIERHGAVAEETAREMAEGTRRICGADYGISTTGIAGPGGGTPEKPVGTVCIGYSGPDKRSFARRYQFTCGQRSKNKRMFAFSALDLLRRELMM